MFSQPAVAEGDPEAGRELGYTCLGCHGIEGYRNAYPSYRVPKLGGQNPDLAAKIVEQVYELALLSQRELDAKDLAAFVDRSTEVMTELAQQATQE